MSDTLLAGLERGMFLDVAGQACAKDELIGAVGAVAAQLSGITRVALWATPALETCLGVAGAIAAGVTVVPLDPHSSAAELDHILQDSAPQALLASPWEPLPGPLAEMPRLDPSGRSRQALPTAAIDDEATAFVMYTSGTTGRPKGVPHSRRSIAACIDGLADAWQWGADDVLVHGLPLFHVHGLILGVAGPLRLGGGLRHVGRFRPAAVAAGVEAGGTVVFGVPTMWSRIASDASASVMSQARLLVSGSAGLPRPVFDDLAAVAGSGPIERYGMTETLIVAAARADAPRVPGSVGPAIHGTELRLAQVEDGVGDLEVLGPTVFKGYLNRPDTAAESFTDDGWFRTGDIATRGADGTFRIVGRRATDLIKSGGHRVGAGEIEGVLLAHPSVAETAVVGVPDDHLGERIVAYVVESEPVTEVALVAYVDARLTRYKQPREYRFVDTLPRNAMGKVIKSALREERVDPSS
ncbi:MAG: AMP-binding protein [Marmoricola sp.]